MIVIVSQGMGERFLVTDLNGFSLTNRRRILLECTHVRAGVRFCLWRFGSVVGVWRERDEYRVQGFRFELLRPQQVSRSEQARQSSSMSAKRPTY